VFRLAGFRTAYVFDSSQTEGRRCRNFPRPPEIQRNNGEKLKALVAKLVAKQGFRSNTTPAARQRKAYPAAGASG